MSDILFIDGQIVFQSGQIVFTDDAAECECCAQSCFPDCETDPTNSAEVTGATGSDFCTDANGTYAEERAYSDEGTYHQWIWKKSGLLGLPLERAVLIIRCDKETGEVAARIDYTGTDVDWGGSDSIWAGFKVITGLISCVDGNLTGTFDLDSIDWCSGSVTVVL